MSGIYGLFYKKDEVLAQETLGNLSYFYHNLMINQINEEFKEAKNNFPLLSFNLKNEKDCSFSPLQKELEIIINKYNDTDIIIDIENGFILKSEDINNEIELQCHLDKNKKYCKKKMEQKSLENIH